LVNITRLKTISDLKYLYTILDDLSHNLCLTPFLSQIRGSMIMSQNKTITRAVISHDVDM